MNHPRWTTVLICAVMAVPLAADRTRIAEAPDLPPTVEPLAAEGADELLPLIDAAERFRGLGLRVPLSAGRQTQEAARASLAELLAEEVTPEEAATAERVLRILGLWNIERDLTAVLLDVLSSEVAGYYDPERDFLALVEGVGDAHDPGDLGEAMAERLTGSIWVHEISHALQDQHFDLEAVGGVEEELLSDRSLAREALVEGDASLVMFSYVLGLPLERLPMVDEMLAAFSDPAEIANMAAGSADALLEAPAFVREVLIFPYLRGLTFCLALRQAGGQKLLDHAFTNDPPSSTEQILHPEKWLETRDEPVAITMPDLGPLLGGRERRTVDDLGELGIAIVLVERLGEGARERAAQAAAGWGGDALGLWGSEGGAAGDVLVWISEWDDAAEADEFVAAAREAFGGDGWTLAHRDTRAVLVHGLSDAAGVVAASMAAPAERQPLVAVDLAALGIDDGDRPAPVSMDEMIGVLGDPAMRDAVSEKLGEDATDLLATIADDSAIRELVTSVAEDAVAGGDIGALIGDMDLEELASSPTVKALREQILAQQEPAQVRVEDDRVVHIGETGLTLTLPIEGAWRRNEDLDAPDGGVVPSFHATELVSEVSVMVLRVRLPMPTMLEAVVAGARAEELGDGEVVDSGFLDVGGTRAWQREVIVDTDGDGGRARTIHRVFVLGRDIVNVVVGGPAKKWQKKRAAMVAATFAGIRIDEPPAPQAAEPAQGEAVAAGEGVIRPPRKLLSFEPDYPSGAKDERVEGQVRVKAVIGADGRVGDQVDVLSSPDERLSVAVIEALRRWRFRPATLDGEPVEVDFETTFNFRLEADQETPPDR